MPSAGSVHVDVLPDTKRFGPQLRTQLRAIAAKERPTVRVNIRTNTGEVLTRLQAIDHQLDRLDRRRIRIDVTPDLDKFGARLESRLSRVSQVAGAKAGRDAGDEFARRFDARLNRLAPKLHRLAQLRIESDAGKARADMVALDKLADRLDGRIVRMRVRTTGVQGLTGGPVGSGRPATQRPSAGKAPSAGALDSLFQDRLNKALSSLPDFSPDADGARGRLGMLRGELADLSSRRIGVDMDSGTAMGLVREMQRELHALSRSRDIDVRVNAGRARAELAALQAQANALDSTRPTINVGVRSNKQLEKFSDASPLATTAIAALVPPAVPLAGAAVGGAAGLLPGLGAGMMGLGAFATAAIPGIMGVSKALDLQAKAAEGSEEAIEEYAAAMDAMTPQVRSLYDAWGDLQTVHSEWQTDLQSWTMPPLTRWLGLASDHMRQLTPIVAGTGKALDNLAESADKGLTGPYWTSFIDFSARQAEPTLTSLGRTFGWLALGVTGLMVSFEPLWESMSTGMERSSRSFADWANNADNFTGFISWTIENGPILMGVLGDLFGAIIDVGVAIAPLGMVYAQGIGMLAQGLSWLAETSPGLLQLAVAAFTARMALQLLTRINQGMLVPMREGVGRVAEFAGSLRQVDSAATTAAGGTSRFSGALGGALGMLGGPWGIALLAATTALGVFIAKKQEAKAKTEEYTAALRDDTNATQENLRQQAAANLEKEGALQIAEQYGISTRDVTAAALGEADAMQRVTASIAEQEAYWEQAHKNGEISASTRDGAISQLVQLKGAIDAESAAMEGAVESASRVDEANGSATESQNGLNASMREGATVARDLKTALDDLTSGAVTVTAAESDFQAAVDRANESISTNGATLDLTTEAGRRNEQSLRDIRDRTNDLISAQKENGATTEVMISTQKSARDEFVRVAKQMGLTESAAQDLADEYLGLPHQVKTQIEVSASGTWTNVSTSTPGQQQQLFSTGGAVHGPGTATSDDIPAWLSNGEFVQRTAAVQKYGVGFMSALNEGRIHPDDLPGFARGGYVSNGKGETPWARISSHQGNVRRDYVRMVRELTALVGDSMGEEFKTMMRGPQGVVRLAEASLGKYPEVPNGSNKNAITSWFGMNGAPWCAMYISWLFNRANASAALGGASRTAWTGDYYNSGMRRVSSPMPGDVAVYGTDHVNLVVSPGGGRRIGGNQSNNVTAAPYSGGAIFRPNWSKVGFASGGLVSMQDLMAQNLGEDRSAGQTNLVRSIRQAVGLDERPVQRARGGRVRDGQWSWVGEEGPELVRFSSPGQVYSAQQSQAIAAQSARMQARGTDGSSAPLIGSMPVTVHSGEHAVREVVEEITHNMRVAKTGGRYSDG